MDIERVVSRANTVVDRTPRPVIFDRIKSCSPQWTRRPFYGTIDCEHGISDRSADRRQLITTDGASVLPGAHSTRLILSVAGVVVIFSRGIVTRPAASALTLPLAEPKLQWTVSSGRIRSVCRRRSVMSAVASVGIVTLVLSVSGVGWNSDISATVAVSRTSFQRKNALIWPDALLSVWSGHGRVSSVDAFVKTGRPCFGECSASRTS